MFIMGLKIKSQYDTLKSLIDWTTSRSSTLTDFNPGSALRTLYEAVSVQLEEFYFRMKQSALYAITNSIYQAFNFERKVAGKATGEVTVNFLKALPTTFTIPKGTIFSTNDVYGYIQFETTEDYYIEPGMISAIIPVTCQQAGTIGNVPEGAISVIIPHNSNIRNVYNEASFTNGHEDETATEHKKRFQKYINTLSRATSNSILYGALQVEGVAGAWVDDNYIGYVILYAHDSSGNLPEELRDKIVKELVDYRAGGIEVEVLPIVKVEVNRTFKIMLEDDYDVETYSILIYSAITNFLNEYTVGNDFHIADVLAFIKSSYEDEVINVIPDSYDDIVLQKNQLIRPGDIVVDCVNQKDWRYGE